MIDMHVHSTMSDGTYTPTQIAQLAHQIGLEAFALTDHDTIYGDEEAALAAKKYNIDFLNGMEMSLTYDNHIIHVVALGFNKNHSAFKEFYNDLRYKKEASIRRVIDYLANNGLDISLTKVEPYKSGDGVDKYAILRYLIAEESAKGDIQFIWDNYIDPAYRNLKLSLVENPQAEDALIAIKKSGGVTSLAHFHKKIGFLGYSRQQQEHHIAYLHEMGLDGMEAYYPTYSDDDRAFAHYLIKKYNLMPSGGTDFHGKNRPSTALGTGINNNMNVPYSFFENIFTIIKRRHNHNEN